MSNNTDNTNQIGSSLDDFLKEDGIYEECHTQAVKEVLAWQLEQAMKEEGLTKSAMAERMQTSRVAVDRLLDPGNDSVTLNTLRKAAVAIGKKLKIELV
ncbi:MAG: XRE family transcriptional regulator [Geobacteraceae bacterium]|nr:XRE family transcriptional regulator [Geobacteraceae bacterium]